MVVVIEKKWTMIIGLFYLANVFFSFCDVACPWVVVVCLLDDTCRGLFLETGSFLGFC